MGTIAKALLQDLTLTERMQRIKNQPVLLIDISGSTNRDIEPGCSELQAMKNIVRDLNSDIPIYVFSNDCRRVTRNTFDSLPKGSGGTFMGSAFITLKANKRTKVIMITDGEATDKDLALEAAKNLDLRIMFVGPGNKPEFLDQLAKVGNGYCSTEDLTKQQLLTEKLTLLLDSGKDRSINL